MEDTAVVKLSGKALSAGSELRSLFEAMRGKRVVVVHGGGVEVDALFKALDLKVEKKNGLRVSPKEQIPYIVAALAGQCNKRLQSLAVSAGLDALGLMASDGHTLKVAQLSQELGMVGRVSPDSCAFLELLLSHGHTPILCSVCMDDAGEIFNVNADDAAAGIAALLNAPLYFISDVKGVLDGEKNLIPELDAERIDSLIADGTITEGMAVKVRSALEAASFTHAPVYIGSIYDPELASAVSARRRLGTALLS